MTMKMIFRQALDKDVPAITEILGPWITEDQAVLQFIASMASAGPSSEVRCRVLELDGIVKCVSLWIPEKADQVRVLALAAAPGSSETAADIRFLRQEIMAWADMGVSKVSVRVPAPLASSMVSWLRNCGFMFEGICSSCHTESGTGLTFCKHFLYHAIRRSEVMDFLRDFLVGLGYEVRSEGEGFSYRVRSEFQLPFVFSAWHRVMKSGTDLVVQPPARVLEWNELETLFYPLTIRGRDEKPLLIPFERKKASYLVDLPIPDNHQSNLFDRLTVFHPQYLLLNHLIYIDPTGIQGVRKGLPLLFYVNRVGAVGTAKVEDWLLDEAKHLYDSVEQRGWSMPGKARGESSVTGPRSGKVLAMRFQWFRPFRKPVKLEEIRTMEKNFSPQRVRVLSTGLFESIVTRGSGPK
jgi:hypothetical protein